MSTTTNTFPIPPHYLANTAAALGTFITLNNVYATYNPAGALSMLGFPTPISPSDQKLTNGLTRMFAATRVCGGLTTLAMWWFGSYKALGWSMISGVLMAAVDGIVSKDVSGKGEWNHWGAAPVGLGVGVGLVLAESR